MQKKIKVAIVGLNLKEKKLLGKFEITGIPDVELKGYIFNIRKFLTGGLNSVNYSRAITEAKYIDELYRTNDIKYIEATNKLIKNLEGYDVIIFSTFNPLHPEIIANQFKNSIKVIGFIDDPYSTYTRGIPYLWAFDAAYYISPGYSQSINFKDLFEKVGFKKHYWLPLVSSKNVDPFIYPKLCINDISNRENDIIYVGAPVGSKIDKIKIFHNNFKDNFQLYGYWPLKGYYGFMKPLLGESPFFRRVQPISTEKKFNLYKNTKIGLNMHMSDLPSECGNARTYEITAFGMMLLSDRGGLNSQNQIFEENTEAIYYNSIDEAVDLTRYYLKNSKERTRIAMAGHLRARNEYSWENVTHNFLKWLIG